MEIVFTSAPILIHLDFSRPFFLETDWHHSLSNLRRWTISSYCIPFKNFFGSRDQLWNSWQRTLNHYQFFLGMTSLTWRRTTSSHSLHQLQESWIFYVCWNLESLSSTLKYVALSNLTSLSRTVLEANKINSTHCQGVLILHSKGKIWCLINNRQSPWSLNNFIFEHCRHQVQ